MSTQQLGSSVAVPVAASDPDRGVSRRWVLTRRRRTRRTVAVLQHLDHSPGGALLDVLTARGLDPTPIRVDRGESLPDPRTVRMAVVLGSESATGEGDLGWVRNELEWLRQADRAGTPVLAIGSGAQALATALGGGVESVPRPRRGWIRVVSTAPELISPGPWLAWEDDAIRLPGGAELIAYDHVGPQAFRVNGHLGVQFHPEVTPKIVGDWVVASTEVLDTQGIMEATGRDFAASSIASHRLFGSFIDSVADREP